MREQISLGIFNYTRAFTPLSLIILLITSTPAFAETSDWSGNWDTIWRNGGARMVLTQEGNQVSGFYEPYGGKVNATVQGSRLSGEWRQAKSHGKFVFTLAPDGETFMGRYDTGEWWNGERSRGEDSVTFKQADLSSPRSAIKSFLIAFNQIEYGEYQFAQMALQTLDFSELNSPSPKEQMRLAQAFFSILNQCTLRIWDVSDGKEKHFVDTEFNQAGTDGAVAVSFVRDKNDLWRMKMKELTWLQAKYKALLDNRGIEGIEPNAHLKLHNPRAVMRTFIEQIKHWANGGKEYVMRSMNLSAINDSIVEKEAEIYAEFLKHILDRSGYLIWQEIPDNPDSRLPYIHFEHPLGNIVIAPGEYDGKRIWQFDRQTIASLKELHTAFEDMPLADGLSGDLELRWFFRVRNQLRPYPWMIEKFFDTEVWQWSGLMIIIILGVILARWFAKLSIVIARWTRALFGVRPGSGKVTEFYHPLRITLIALLWQFGFTQIGLPENLFLFANGITSLIVTVGIFWIAFRLTDWLGQHFRERAQNTATQFDDILVSLVTGLAKVILAAASIIFIADILAIPYQSILAGLGIGGLALAFAARETIADFFGSAVLLTDRPFRQGDRVNIGDVQGYIEYVGLRSTQIRTIDDSIMTIPNSRLANEIIDNRKRRNTRHFKTRISVTYDTPPEKLEAFAEKIKEVVLQQPTGLSQELHCGVWAFGDSTIDLQLFCYLKVKNRSEEYEARNRLMTDIIRAAQSLSIEFAFPTRTLHLNKKPVGLD